MHPFYYLLHTQKSFHTSTSSIKILLLLLTLFLPFNHSFFYFVSLLAILTSSSHFSSHAMPPQYTIFINYIFHTNYSNFLISSFFHSPNDTATSKIYLICLHFTNHSTATDPLCECIKWVALILLTISPHLLAYISLFSLLSISLFLSLFPNYQLAQGTI